MSPEVPPLGFSMQEDYFAAEAKSSLAFEKENAGPVLSASVLVAREAATSNVSKEMAAILRAEWSGEQRLSPPSDVPETTDVRFFDGRMEVDGEGNLLDEQVPAFPEYTNLLVRDDARVEFLDGPIQVKSNFFKLPASENDNDLRFVDIHVAF